MEESPYQTPLGSHANWAVIWGESSQAMVPAFRDRFTPGLYLWDVRQLLVRTTFPNVLLLNICFIRHCYMSCVKKGWVKMLDKIKLGKIKGSENSLLLNLWVLLVGSTAIIGLLSQLLWFSGWSLGALSPSETSTPKITNLFLHTSRLLWSQPNPKGTPLKLWTRERWLRMIAKYLVMCVTALDTS